MSFYYVDQQYQFLLELQQTRWPEKSGVSVEARASMVSLLFELSMNHTKQFEIFFQSVWCMDMFLCKWKEGNLTQVYGTLLPVVCYILAAKYEDETLHDLGDLQKIAQTSSEGILQAERKVWETIDYNIMCPNFMLYTRYLSWEADSGNTEIRTLAKYLLALVIFNEEYIEYGPVLLTAAAIYTARQILNYEITWTELHVKKTGILAYSIPFNFLQTTVLQQQKSNVVLIDMQRYFDITTQSISSKS